MIAMAVVFDFDQTLAIIETYSVGSNPTNQVFGGKARLVMLDEMLLKCRSAGLKLAIVSRNSKHVVKQALSAVNLDGYFVCPHHSGTAATAAGIYGREDLSMGGLGPKSSLINEKIVKRHGLDINDCLFLDDDSKNTADVKKHVGCEVIWVRQSGMSRADMAQVLEFVDSLPFA